MGSQRIAASSHGMGLLKPNKTRSVVGLDIEPGFVAAAEFTGGSSPRLVKAATSPLGPGLFHEGEVVDVDGLSEKLRAFFREHELPKRVRLGVASQKIAVRVIELPKIDNEQELEAAVRFQAQEELPMPLEQAVLAHRVLERLDDGENPRMRVLVVGARRDSVNHLLAVARRAGLNPELVDLSAFAMIPALYVPRQNGSAQGSLDEPVVHQFPGELAAPPQGEAFEEAHPESFEEAHAEPYVKPDAEEALGEVHPEPHDEAQIETHTEAQIETHTEPQIETHTEAHRETYADAHRETYVEAHPGAATGEGEAVAAAAGNGNGAAPAETDPASLATVYCYIGGLTNLAIAVGTNCVFNRVLHNGIESMAATLAERKGLTLDHSREWLRYVGLERDLESIEGEREIISEAREVLENGARRIADEVRLSMEYYHSTVPDAPRVEAAVMAGPGIAVAGLSTLFEQQLGMPVEARSMGRIDVQPGALDGVDSPSLTIATGLALDEVTK
jgi:Tfp pilus assembly PilM family ATPase